MASLSYELMNAFYVKSREALSNNRCEESFVWSLCESSVNNIHHGKYPHEWLPTLRLMLESNLADEKSPELIQVWHESLELTDVAIALLK